MHKRRARHYKSTTWRKSCPCVHTSLPGHSLRVHVQAGEATDLLVRQGVGVGLLDPQFLRPYKETHWRSFIKRFLHFAWLKNRYAILLICFVICPSVMPCLPLICWSGWGRTVSGLRWLEPGGCTEPEVKETQRQREREKERERVTKRRGWHVNTRTGSVHSTPTREREPWRGDVGTAHSPCLSACSRGRCGRRWLQPPGCWRRWWRGCPRWDGGWTAGVSAAIEIHDMHHTSVAGISESCRLPEP